MDWIAWVEVHKAFIVIAALWTVPWKGVALWKAARGGSKPWFVVFLIVHTLGILEILYIFIFSKPKSPAMIQSQV